jgi:hypothetical protein
MPGKFVQLGSGSFEIYSIVIRTIAGAVTITFLRPVDILAAALTRKKVPFVSASAWHHYFRSAFHGRRSLAPGSYSECPIAFLLYGRRRPIEGSGTPRCAIGTRGRERTDGFG